MLPAARGEGESHNIHISGDGHKTRMVGDVSEMQSFLELTTVERERIRKHKDKVKPVRFLSALLCLKR